MRVYEPFGFRVFEVDPSADQQVKTGRKAMRSRAPAKHPRKTKLSQTRPNNGEGAHEFAQRVAKRFGFTIWPSADGETLYVSKPDFDQQPTFRLIRRRSVSRENNILSGGGRFDLTDQPSAIIADGFSGGGVFGKSKIRVIAFNPCVVTSPEDTSRLLQEHRSAKLLALTDASGALLEEKFRPLRNPRAKPLFLHDENSKTLEQLEENVRREMMARVRKALSYRVLVKGHSQASVPWTIDTVVDVQDEVAGVIEPMWVLSRTFHKSRGGTTTELELIRLHSLEI